MMSKKLKIFIMSAHHTYYLNLAKTNHYFYLPKELSYNYAWPNNILTVDNKYIHKIDFDLIIFNQDRDLKRLQFKYLLDKQRQSPKIFIFHTQRPQPRKIDFNDHSIFVVYISKANSKQWLCPYNRTKVIPHGIPISKIKYKGNVEKSITAINNFAPRPYFPLWKKINKKIPSVLVGDGSEKIGGLGAIAHDNLIKFISPYRVYLNLNHGPTSYSMLEAMSIGMPVVSIKTGDIPSLIRNNQEGFVSNNPKILIQKLELLLKNKTLAQKLGQNARNRILQKHNMKNFIDSWNYVFKQVV